MINQVHDRVLRVCLGDDLSDFESLLRNNKDICSDHKNIQSLTIEMFMESTFERRNESYNLHNFQEFSTER